MQQDERQVVLQRVASASARMHQESLQALFAASLQHMKQKEACIEQAFDRLFTLTHQRDADAAQTCARPAQGPELSRLGAYKLFCDTLKVVQPCSQPEYMLDIDSHPQFVETCVPLLRLFPALQIAHEQSSQTDPHVVISYCCGLDMVHCEFERQLEDCFSRAKLQMPSTDRCRICVVTCQMHHFALQNLFGYYIAASTAMNRLHDKTEMPTVTFIDLVYRGAVPE